MGLGLSGFFRIFGSGRPGKRRNAEESVQFLSWAERILPHVGSARFGSAKMPRIRALPVMGTGMGGAGLSGFFRIPALQGLKAVGLGPISTGLGLILFVATAMGLGLTVTRMASDFIHSCQTREVCGSTRYLEIYLNMYRQLFGPLCCYSSCYCAS